MKKLRFWLVLSILSIFLAGCTFLLKPKDALVFYAGTPDGVFRITQDGHTEMFSTTINASLSAWNGCLYDGTHEYRHIKGRVEKNPLPVQNVQVVGFGKIVKICNVQDTVTFYNMDGDLIVQYGMLKEPDSHLQNTNGLFLDEDTFILSENGLGAILKYSIESGVIETIAEITEGWFGAITYDEKNQEFYVASWNRIFKFSEGESIELVASSLPGNITGLVLTDDFIFFTANFANGLYRYNRLSSEHSRVADLNFPCSLVALSW